LTAALAAALLAAAAPAVAKAPASGVVLGVDGKVYAHAKVCVDRNRNARCDGNEASVFSGADDPFTAVHHPLEPWSLDVHVLAAPVLVFAFGWIFKDHVLAKLTAGGVPARRSGVLGVILFVPMVLSGYLLQVVTRESLHAPLVVIHLISGGLFALTYGIHLLLAHKRPRNGSGLGALRMR